MRCIFFPILLTFCIGGQNASSYPPMAQLLNERLFKSYNKDVRPGAYHTNTTSVQISVAPLYITDLDEEKSLLTFEAHMSMVWTDERLAWNSSDFNGIHAIRVSNTFPWLPDIVVYNSPSEKWDIKDNSNVVVYDGGHVMWLPSATIATICPIKLENGHPDDFQTCAVTLGSWTYDARLIDLTVAKDNFDYIDFLNVNPRWEVLLEESKMTRIVKKYPCCEEPYVVASGKFVLQRRPGHHFEVVKIPCLMVLVLMLFMFWMPPRHGQKIIFGSILVLILTILLVYVANSAKAKKTKADAESLLRAAMILVISATILDVVLMSAMRCLVSCAPPKFLLRFLYGPMKIFSCISLTSKKSDDNADLHVEEDDVKGYNNNQKIYNSRFGSEPQTASSAEEWILIGGVVEKILFVVFSIALIPLFC